MALEKIIKYAKVVSTNRFIPLTYVAGGIAIGATFVDEGTTNTEISSLLISGVSLAGVTAVSFIEYRLYRDVVRFCEKHGFREITMKNKPLRRKAKIYASESGRMEEFELALER